MSLLILGKSSAILISFKFIKQTSTASLMM